MWNVWEDENAADSNRLDAIRKYAYDGYIYTNPDSARYFTQLMYDFALEKQHKKYQAKAKNIQGLSYFFQKKFDRAIKRFDESISISRELGDDGAVANALYNKGLIYYELNDYVGATNHYLKSLTIQEKTGNQRAMAVVLNAIGNTYSGQGEYEKASEHYLKSLDIQRELGNERGVAVALNNLGNFYRNQSELRTALNYYIQAAEKNRQVNAIKNLVDNLSNIGYVYHGLGKSDSATASFEEVLSLSEEIGYQTGLINAYIGYANVYQGTKQFNQAIAAGNKALQLSQEISSLKYIRFSSRILWELHKKENNYQKALDMHELYTQTLDSIESEENQRAVFQQEYKYQYEKQATIDSVANAQKEQLAQQKLDKQKAISAKQNAEIKQKQTQQYALFGGLALVIVFAGFIFNRFRITQKQKKVIEAQKSEVEIQKEVAEEKKLEAEHQKELVEEKNKEIMDSINYAQRLQNAILPPKKLVKQWLPQSFILYKPKDIVAGDFYWMETLGDVVYFAAADCTGHGVPGAMVSVVCSNALSKALIEEKITEPAKILDRTRELVIDRFGRSEEEIKDGMDVALCALNTETNVLHWAGANNPLWIIRKSCHPEPEELRAKGDLRPKGESKEDSLPPMGAKIEEIDDYTFIELKADKMPIGKYGELRPFTNHEIHLHEGDAFYIFSDGFPDQFGGEKGKKYKSGKLKKYFISIQDQGMQAQRELLNQEFESWRGDIEQIDDVCVIGVRV